MDNSADGAIAQPDTHGRSSLAAVDCRVHELLLRQERQERTTLKLIAAGAHPNPVRHCDVVSSTSHKSIRDPRGGFILSRNEDRYQALYHPKSNLARRIDRAVFPHLQGGPHMNVIAALAVASHEAANPSFRSYGQQTLKNAKALAQALLERGYDLVTRGDGQSHADP